MEPTQIVWAVVATLAIAACWDAFVRRPAKLALDSAKRIDDVVRARLDERFAAAELALSLRASAVESGFADLKRHVITLEKSANRAPAPSRWRT